MTSRTLAAAAAALALAVPAAAGDDPTDVPGGVWAPTLAADSIGEPDAAAFADGTGFVVGTGVPSTGTPADPFAAFRPVYKTADGGLTWERLTVPRDVGEMAFGTPTQWWAERAVGTLSRTTNAGASWSTVTVPLAAGERLHYGVASLSASGDAVAFAGQVTSSPLHTPCPSDEADAIFWSADGGATWEVERLPVYTSTASPRVQSLDVGDEDSGVALMWPDAAACGDAESPLAAYVTDDAGATWDLVVPASTTGPGVQSATMGPDGTLAIGFSDGTVKVSQDGGATFTSTKLHRTETHAPPASFGGGDAILSLSFNGAAGYAVATSGAVWRTTDTGATWALDGVHAAWRTAVYAFDADRAMTTGGSLPGSAVAARVP